MSMVLVLVSGYLRWSLVFSSSSLSQVKIQLPSGLSSFPKKLLPILGRMASEAQIQTRALSSSHGFFVPALAIVIQLKRGQSKPSLDPIVKNSCLWKFRKRRFKNKKICWIRKWNVWRGWRFAGKKVKPTFSSFLVLSRNWNFQN